MLHPNAPTAATLLHTALRQARATNTLRQLALAWPAAPVIAERLAGWLTDTIPNRTSAEPLLVTCLRQGKAALLATPVDDLTRRRAWLRGLLAPLPSLLDWRVEHGNSGQVWPPLGDEPLLVWRQRGSGHLHVARQPATALLAITPDSVRLWLAAHLLHGSDLAALGGHLPRLLGDGDG
jgi:hypothetical protein